ncbi:MAG: hypothetical protein RIF33_10410 [Cyclobacteriaceae bacterium]
MLKKLTIRKLFLIDAIGAIVTAGMLGLVLPKLEPYIGMPQYVLNPLAMAVCVYAVYSFACYWLIPRNGQVFLRAIAIANSLYCAVTLGLIIYLFDGLTLLGIIYFLGEISVILALVRLEWNATRR